MTHSFRFLTLMLALLMAGFHATAQTDARLTDGDRQLLRRTGATQQPPRMRTVTYGFGGRGARGGVVYHLFASSMYAYQRFVSPSIARSCSYNPTCSGYSRQLIARYGLPMGIVCSADRITRCNRIALADRNSLMLFSPADHRIHESVERYSLRTAND